MRYLAGIVLIAATVLLAVVGSLQLIVAFDDPKGEPLSEVASDLLSEEDMAGQRAAEDARTAAQNQPLMAAGFAAVVAAGLMLLVSVLALGAWAPRMFLVFWLLASILTVVALLLGNTSRMLLGIAGALSTVGGVLWYGWRALLPKHTGAVEPERPATETEEVSNAP